MGTEVCLCGATEPCYGGPCHFVDTDALAALDLWLYWAERVRGTCTNVEEYDLLIAGQRKRRADLLGLDPPSKVFTDLPACAEPSTVKIG